MLQQTHSLTGLGRAQALRSALLTLAIVAAAVWQQASLGLNTDVSWLLVVGERVLSGSRLYVDIFEVNPPASVWLTLPQVALAKATGLHAEAIVAGSVFLVAALSTVLTGSILSGSRVLARDAALRLMPLTAAILLILPGGAFAQREHWAVLFLLPWLALMVARLRLAKVPRGAALLAGIGAGLAVAIKPPFAAAAGLPLLWSAWRKRRWTALVGAEALAAAAVPILYVGSVFVLLPAYFEHALPLLRDGYLAVREPLSVLLGSPYVIVSTVIAAVALVLARAQRNRDLVHCLLLALLGFGLAMLVQGKGFFNHHLPGAMLATVALAVTVAGARERAPLGWVLLLAGGGWLSFLAAHVTTYPSMTELVRRTGPERPRLIVAATNLSIGHPLTRQVNGQWVGSRGGLWATGTAVTLLDRTTVASTRRRLQEIIDEDRRQFVSDVERGRPDLVIADRAAGFEWIRDHPEVAAALADYCVAGEVEGLVLLSRRSPAAAPHGLSGWPAPVCSAGTAESGYADR